jgi:hypothetical protein
LSFNINYTNWSQIIIFLDSAPAATVPPPLSNVPVNEHDSIDSTSIHPHQSSPFDEKSFVRDEDDVPGTAEAGDDAKLSFLSLLRHFATYTNQKHEHMTYLLSLLKFYKPVPDYDRLPSTGAQLLPISGNDWPGGTNSGTLPKPTVLEDGGKYLHFGVEHALNGVSAGVLHKEANLLQFVDVYKENPKLLPTPLREKVFVLAIYYGRVCSARCCTS